VAGAGNSTLKNTLAVDRHRVFIAGFDDQIHFLVQAYDAKTGTLLWMDRVSEENRLGHATALTLEEVDGKHGNGEREAGNHEGNDVRLFATGIVGCDPVTFVDCKLAVRAYDPRRGLVWHRADHARGGDWDYTTYPAVVDRRLFVGVEELLDDGQYHATLRSYSLTNGALKWTLPFEEGSGQPIGFVVGLFVQQGRLVVGGSLYRPDGGADFVVRMYRPREADKDDDDAHHDQE
jgi:outer membrane protein assembly factor BamB